MVPDVQQPQKERRFCALGNHRLRPPIRELKNEYLVRFANIINSEIRIGQLICGKCLTSLLRLYKEKNENAKKHKLLKEGNSVSDASCSQPADSSSDPNALMPRPARVLPPLSESSEWSVTTTVSDKTGQGSQEVSGILHTSSSSTTVRPTANNEDVQEDEEPGGSQTSSRNCSSVRPTVNIVSIQQIRQPSGIQHNFSQSSDDRPTTSAAAAKKRQRSERDDEAGPRPQRPRPALINPDTDDYDPNSNLSLNAVNGTRLPHIQPIPKRRPVTHLNKEAMDIYLAGTTGG
ncbi:uncharacterized protein LOC108108435 [Drosophila eugracilis]|uniref:uncharacterized protein LOC108108435 n=1 Tax=Drosophila eugracilis TaxID=29029 RepID=UPI0007E5CBCD|nr:uncharacterized protein LOC108108435 [Drosophila eugracilis]